MAGDGGCGNTSAGGDRIKPPRFSGFISWTLFHLQFEVVAEYNWTDQEKATHLTGLPG
jgi:hypothetical protein